MDFLFINQLTVRQSANDYILSGDTWPVLVVGHHAEAVLGVLPQSGQGVGLNVYVNILKE